MGRRERRGAAVAAAALALGAGALVRRVRAADLRGRIVLVTGGSRGLGFLLAREFGRQGCQVVICARDEAELERARADLVREGTAVLALRCDVGDRRDVERLAAETLRRCGRVDVLVNNAGLIEVGPLVTATAEDFERALDVMFWGMLHPTLALVPHMRARGSGHIVNITSIGGKVSVPHLLPYGCAKFAALGLSEGLRAELAQDGIRVVTIVPGLMRTGSYVNAAFRGRQDREYRWFALGATLPLLSMDAERAARAIVRATRRGDAEYILSWPAKLAARIHGLFPGLISDLLALVNRFVLPAPDGAGRAAACGTDIERRLRSPVFGMVTALGERAGRRFHERDLPSGRG